MTPSIAIVGPTACGKTRRAVEAARAFNGEILSADSRQVYRSMDIGTGKDLDEYGDVPYHLIDICDAGHKYNLHEYLRDFRKAYADVQGRGHRPVICGGSGMYVENALKGIYLPEVPQNDALRQSLQQHDLPELARILSTYKTLHNITDIDTKARAIRAIEIQEYYVSHPEEAAEASSTEAKPLDCVIVGLDIPRDLRRKRITDRLHQRLEEGMVAEIEGIIGSGVSPEDLIYYGLEYKYVTLYVTGKLKYEDMVKELECAIHQFAKRQMTWFRGMERRGLHINWLPYDLTSTDFLKALSELLHVSGF